MPTKFGQVMMMIVVIVHRIGYCLFDAQFFFHYHIFIDEYESNVTSGCQLRFALDISIPSFTYS